MSSSSSNRCILFGIAIAVFASGAIAGKGKAVGDVFNSLHHGTFLFMWEAVMFMCVCVNVYLYVDVISSTM